MTDRARMTLHCGGKVVDLEALEQIPLPEQTSSYIPVPHYDLVQMVRNTSQELLRLDCIKETYALAKDGNRMFFLQTFGSWEDPAEHGFSVVGRNSYDKSMSLGLAAGFRVFICDNLVISGDINILRKHTKGIWDDIDKILVHTLFRKGPEIRHQFYQTISYLQHTLLSQEDGWRHLGYLLGSNILTVTQVSNALRLWGTRFDDNVLVANAWELYNDCTSALKSTPIRRVLEAHQELHQYMARAA